ncbi:uncharacterized protein LOC135370390 isoform X2 [Ornithodoros turicata]|uniref:uncharacterized protein LOC135370390 isoform X2 n=1 Tax=Ornithodoros turicata TaxID=34597 RepID=UPI003138F44C
MLGSRTWLATLCGWWPLFLVVEEEEEEGPRRQYPMAHVILQSDLIVENVLQFVDVEDLFSCCEVNKTWQETGLKMLRKRLVSVAVSCMTDTDQETTTPVDDVTHVCPETLCSRFTRYRNIARMAGLRPTLVFLSYYVDLSQNKSVVDSVRALLPSDSVIVYFKLEVVRTQDGMEDRGHEGIVGEFVFRTDAGLVTPEKASAIGMGRLVPPPSSDGGAVFHNVLPGVLVFQALHVTDANFEGRAVTSYFTESATRRLIQAAHPAAVNMSAKRILIVGAITLQSSTSCRCRDAGYPLLNLCPGCGLKPRA